MDLLLSKGMDSHSLHKVSHSFSKVVPSERTYIAMGYRMSKHASLFHFSPYILLFGKHPISPSFITAQMDQVVDLDSSTTWVKVIAKRAALFRKVVPMAMENLSIAQHRDTLRYAHTRGGNYKLKVKQFDVGDFVYF